MSTLKTTDTVQLVVNGKEMTLRDLRVILEECTRRSMSFDAKVEIEMATTSNLAQVSTITVTDTVGMDAGAY